MAMAPGEQPRIGRAVAATRKSRSRNWPAQSTVYDRFDSLANYSVSLAGQIQGVGKGMTAGRNFLAYFNDKDNQPRLKYNIHIEHGRPKKLPQFPHPSKFIIPVGTSLDEVCQYYPLHVWSDGLRIFMAENWTAERIFRLLPEETRNAGAANRPWNYLQQAMGREADKMYEEDDYGPRVVTKRKRDDTESSGQLQGSNTAAPAEKRPRLTPQGASLVQQPSATVAPQVFTASHILIDDDDGDDEDEEFDWSVSPYKPAEMVVAAFNRFAYPQPMFPATMPMVSTAPMPPMSQVIAMPTMPAFPARQQVDLAYDADVDTPWSFASSPASFQNTCTPSVAYNGSPEYIGRPQANEFTFQGPISNAPAVVVANDNVQEVVECNTHENNADANTGVDAAGDADDEGDDHAAVATAGSSKDESDGNNFDGEFDGDEYDDSDEETASNDDAFATFEPGHVVDAAYANPSQFIPNIFAASIENTADILPPQIQQQVASEVALYLQSVAGLSEAPTAYASMGDDFAAEFAEPGYYQDDDNYADVDPYGGLMMPEMSMMPMIPMMPMTPEQQVYNEMMMPQEEVYDEIMPFGGYGQYY